ncbi:MAG: hypothetical protein VX689_03320 [Bacteroidota bacterium]|nr:hypothetical protein [Bacteroidota bacterium]
MKNIALIIVISTFLFGCGKSGSSPDDITNNPGGTNNSASILGTWDVVTIEESSTSGYIDPIYGTEVEIQDTSYIYFNDTVQRYLVFAYDGIHKYYTYHLDTFAYVSDFIYVKNNNTISIYDSIINDSALVVDLNITTLTNNNLNFSFNDYGTWEFYDTTYFWSSNVFYTCLKSQLPSITTEPLKKRSPVNNYKSFFDRRTHQKGRID